MTRFPICLLLLGVAQATAADFPILEECSAQAPVRATIAAGDPLQVHFGVDQDEGRCYSVTATKNGQNVKGYLMGADHPAVVMFLKRREEVATQRVGPPPPPSPPPPPAPAVPPEPVEPPLPEPDYFEDFRAPTVQGESFLLSRLRGKAFVVYFWSSKSPQFQKDADTFHYVWEQYHAKGLEMVGINVDGNVEAAQNFCNENEMVWTNVMDRGKLAKTYGATKFPAIYILDGEQKVIGQGIHASEMEGRIKGLLGLR
jgi:peroxiredoxin